MADSALLWARCREGDAAARCALIERFAPLATRIARGMNVPVGAVAGPDDLVGFETVSHPLFDDLARLFANRFAKHDMIDRLLRPLGLAVWLSDLGRLELRSSAFLPAQRELALAG